MLGDLLAQEELTLELLSGGDEALRRPVAGAHAVELEAPTRFLARDWILLSAGPRLRGNRRAQRDLVAELDGAGVTALGFGIQPVFEHVPPALLAEARARSFPVFAVAPDTPFRNIVSAVNRCLSSGELVNYQRLSSMQRYLMDALQEDEPEQAVITRLAKLVDARILILDPSGVVEQATGPGPVDDIWQRIADGGELVQEFDAGGWHTVAMPIVASPGRPPRWLAVTSPRGEFVNQLTKPAAQASVPLLAAIRRLGEVARDQERAIRSALLRDALNGWPADPAEAHAMAARAASFGLTFEEPARIALAREPARRADGGQAVDPGPLCQALERVLADAGTPHLVAEHGSAAIALAQCDAAELLAALGEPLDVEPPVVVGVGRPVHDLADVHHSLRDAEVAVERLAYEQGRRLLAFEDFDLGTLLLSEAATERIRPKVEGLLEPLQAHPLLHDAVVAYFTHEMDIGRTAEALHLHPNTLRYRLSRLEQLLDVSLKQPAAISALYLAMLAGDRAGT